MELTTDELLNGSNRLVITQGRNADFKEFSLMKDNMGVFTCAQVYGFRHIQNLVRKIKTGRCAWDYMEVMACPSACINGGGQLKSQNVEWNVAGSVNAVTRAWIHQAESVYQCVKKRSPADNPHLEKIYRYYKCLLFIINWVGIGLILCQTQRGDWRCIPPFILLPKTRMHYLSSGNQ